MNSVILLLNNWDQMYKLTDERLKGIYLLSGSVPKFEMLTARPPRLHSLSLHAGDFFPHDFLAKIKAKKLSRENLF